MKKIFPYIFTFLIAFGCQTSGSKEKPSTLADSTTNQEKQEYFNITLQDVVKSKYDLKGILFQDSWAFYKTSKDTLLVIFEEFEIVCGNGATPMQYIEIRSLFNDIKVKAIKYGFKAVVPDSAYLVESDGLANYELQEKFPFYKISMCPIAKDKVIISQFYVSAKGQNRNPQGLDYFVIKLCASANH